MRLRFEIIIAQSKYGLKLRPFELILDVESRYICNHAIGYTALIKPEINRICCSWVADRDRTLTWQRIVLRVIRVIRLALVSSEITRLPQVVCNLLTYLDASQKPVFKRPRIQGVHQLALVEDIVALGRVVVSTYNRHGFRHR